ncbi:MAG: hypothetical protein ACM3S1_06745 [Hyphomicrobiales bacterium]
MAGIKDEAREMIDRLPDDATWNDVAYVFELRRKIERGLADASAGRVTSHEEFKRRFGIKD